MQQNQAPFDLLYKVILAGEYGSGKTSFLVRYAFDKFYEDSIATIGIDFCVKTIQVDNIVCKLQIWDVAAGQGQRPCYHGASGIMILYDVTNRASFNSIPNQLVQIKQSILHYHSIENICFMIVGTKIDLEYKKAVSTEEAQNFAKYNNLLFFEISNVLPIHVSAALESLVREMINKQYNSSSKKYLSLEQTLIPVPKKRYSCI